PAPEFFRHTAPVGEIICGHGFSFSKQKTRRAAGMWTGYFLAGFSQAVSAEELEFDRHTGN
ncbi:MAG: hypothetical protein ACI92Z_003053, partial [Paracoccaceae bacterium]